MKGFIRLSLLSVSFFLLACDISAISEDVEEQIKKLVAGNRYQLSVKEYRLIAQALLKKSPCNLLVFGVGNDSGLWIELNSGGKTLFLEDDASWLKKVHAQLPALSALLVSYNTNCSQWKLLLNNEKDLWLKLPLWILNTSWDLIFVDGPAGNNAQKPGRMKSIYMASYLAQKNSGCEVFIHDCDRVIEASYCERFFGHYQLKATVDRLRHYEVP